MMGCYDVELNGHGYPSTRGRFAWTGSSLMRLLNDRFEARNHRLVGVHRSVRRIKVEVAACEMTTAKH